ncbi:MAG: TIGR03663 family protein, partial [Dehalococcoidia bacterium]|nr:TIGR03663 family protein [Dehalococcoidia bacterium]
MEQARNVFLSIVSRGRARMNWEIALYALLIVIALVMRLWELGARAIHYDEVLHLVYSWNFAQGQGYSHDPMMHGPFQFDGNALIFFLFGDSDFTARLLPVIFGTALVALPFFLRRYLGRWGSLAVATLLAFSPLLLYYSRYARNDIYSAFWSLLLVVCMWRYFEERKARYLYIGAAALSFSFCTKEATYF